MATAVVQGIQVPETALGDHTTVTASVPQSASAMEKRRVVIVLHGKRAADEDLERAVHHFQDQGHKVVSFPDVQISFLSA